jgi:hypothetical protein
MSSQVIRLKSRVDLEGSSRILATRPLEFERRRHLRQPMAARDQARRLPHQGNFTWTSCERLPARFPDPHARNVGLSTAGDHALALRGRESGLEQVEQHVDREAVFWTAQVEWHLAILPLTLVERLIPPAARSIRSNPQARRLVSFGFAVTVACLILPFLITLLCPRNACLESIAADSEQFRCALWLPAFGRRLSVR